ncbi:MAG TPA: hypothetical protein VN844_10700 [Pyrinomonadaceae bacterium]|nr:hypothetical protein [Pyrinomonadaceae bacterium]
MISLPSYSQDKAQKKEQGADFQQFPIVDLFASEPTDPAEKERRAKKGKKYNIKYTAPLSESVDSMFLNVDWDVNLPAFPIEKSAAVVIARVQKAEAHLSEDKTGIYSEFTIKIDAIFKNDPNNQLLNDKSIFAYRTGGRVRFPSGKILVSAVSHQEMPQPKKRYLLFLTHSRLTGGEDEDFQILTGYELTDGQVFPLDKVPSSHLMNKYRGASENVLLMDLSSALAKSPSNPQ